ncbi:aminodeoxychorismate synthase component I [Nocardia arizonensis]|uniref:aminodeoxychorismate synthase component I n=1 Tax=Nocardia arizonensis TaxID=1141647 RepID=UPI0006CF4DED|nr:aminodeoxychorismate synthase component I [Nocardia arizonensis]
MRTLLVDNHDSYTYNLYQLIAATTGVPPTVAYNDDLRWDQLDLDDFDAAIISPGPGNPTREADFGYSAAVIRRRGLPVLGVCLGHQGIGAHFGGRVDSAPRARHGHVSDVRHCEEDLFEGIPNPFKVVRYHSLHVPAPLPGELEALATSEDDVVMALRHRSLPRWGVQFHPESVSTEYGGELIANFLRLARDSASDPIEIRAGAAVEPRSPEALEVQWRVVEHEVDTEFVAREIFGAHERMFWLDSARVVEGMSRFSFLGADMGVAGETLTYDVGTEHVRVHTHTGTHLEAGSIFDALGRRLDTAVAGAEGLPFDLTGGYVGYFGYEMKAECGLNRRHVAPTPDAVWMRADHLVVVDHEAARTYVVAVVGSSRVSAALGWLDNTTRALRSARREAALDPPHDTGGALVDSDAVEPFARPRGEYLDAIARVRERLLAGDSYEVCLTNNVHLPAPPVADELDAYLRLRRTNPAPYAAFLRCGELTVHCSSPERFLRIDRDRVVESKPIKGTAARGATAEQDERLRASLSADPKTRAENLMIVDLLRNDLGRVCRVGTVSVPEFMATETYTTVHQLVSTVRGELADGVGALDVVRACFPGGSMTGAPKLRTTDIVDELETEARGVYSGTLGYLGFNGTADLNIVIRTAVRWRDSLSVGAGGALVLGSDPTAEYEEMLLKAAALARVFLAPRTGLTVGGGRG